jgi:hypothetical protein
MLSSVADIFAVAATAIVVSLSICYFFMVVVKTLLNGMPNGFFLVIIFSANEVLPLILVLNGIRVRDDSI